MAPGSAAAFGALGGAAVQVTESFATLLKYRNDRVRARISKRALPDWRAGFDLGVDVVILMFRALIGAAVALLLRDEFTGATTAVVTGASGPSLLAQWGAAKHFQGDGEPEPARPNDEPGREGPARGEPESEAA